MKSNCRNYNSRNLVSSSGHGRPRVVNRFRHSELDPPLFNFTAHSATCFETLAFSSLVLSIRWARGSELASCLG